MYKYIGTIVSYMETLPEPIFEKPREQVTLTNYYDKFVFCCGGVIAE